MRTAKCRDCEWRRGNEREMGKREGNQVVGDGDGDGDRGSRGAVGREGSDVAAVGCVFGQEVGAAHERVGVARYIKDKDSLTPRRCWILFASSSPSIRLTFYTSRERRCGGGWSSAS